MNHSLTTWQLVKIMTKSVRHLIPHILIAVSFAVMGFLVTLLIPALLVHLVWQALEGETLAWYYLGALILLALSRGLFRYGEHYFGHYVAFRTLADFRKAVFTKLVKLTPAKLDRQDSGHLLKMIGEDIEAMEVFFAHTLPPILTATTTTLILMVYYLRLSGFIALVAFLTYLGLAVILPKVFAERLQPLLKRQTEKRRDYLSLFSDSLKGMKELLQFNQAKAYFEQLEDKSQSVNAIEQKVAVANHNQLTATFFLVGLSIMTVASLAFWHYQENQISLLDMTTVIIVFSTSFAPYLELSRLPLGFKRAINAANQVYTLLEEPELDRSGAQLQEPIEGIVFNNVSFSYDNRSHLIYDNVSVRFDKNKIIGLVGPSGSGKSSLMKLIMRWYNVNHGEVLLNNTTINSFSGHSVQEQIAYIPQHPQLFSQTLRENLLLGKTGISDDEILAASAKCRIKDRILALPNGLDTRIKTEQPLFSAGEMQRLELTRALLKKAECYIFDEPTSHLDSLNEASFLQVVREHCKGYVFLISHRDSTVSSADEIYRVDNKRLIKIK